MKATAASGIAVRGYVSCAIACPYEGAIAPEQVACVAERLFQMGCNEISLGDTVGVGTPGGVQAMLAAVAQRVPIGKLAGHYHDTYGQAIANVYASLEVGIETFDSSVSGLGGCAYAKGATGQRGDRGCRLFAPRSRNRDGRRSRRTGRRRGVHRLQVGVARRFAGGARGAC